MCNALAIVLVLICTDTYVHVVGSSRQSFKPMYDVRRKMLLRRNPSQPGAPAAVSDIKSLSLI